MAPSSSSFRPLLLRPAIKSYAWGDTQFFRDFTVDEFDVSPVAELWYGAHPRGPAQVHMPGKTAEPLDQLVERRPELLGPRVMARYHGLPYLLKVIAASSALSIQVHPNQTQARQGFAREEARGVARDATERAYRDANHKPELLVALSDFEALCGLRPLSEVRQDLESERELASLLDLPSVTDLETIVRRFFALDARRVGTALRQTLDRSKHAPSIRLQRMQRAHADLGTTVPDRGLFFFFLLNFVRMRPGQAMFLQPGVLHAYLSGAGIEVMANSDNVLRAGLTTKAVNVPELLQIARFDAAAHPIMDSTTDGSGARAFVTPAEEFELTVLDVTSEPGPAIIARGAETLLVVAGETAVVHTESTEVPVNRAQACLVPFGTRYRLSSRGTGRASLCRVCVGYSR